MFHRRTLHGVLVATCVVMGSASAWVQAADPTAQQLLETGVKQYQNGNLDAARTTLTSIDAVQLTKEQRVTLTQTLQDIADAQQKLATPPAVPAAKPAEAKATAAPAEPVAQPAAPVAQEDAPAPSPDVLAQAKLLHAQQKLAEGRDAEQSNQYLLAKKLYEEGLAADPKNAMLKTALDAVSAKIAQQDAPKTALGTYLENAELVRQSTLVEFKEMMNRSQDMLKKNEFQSAVESVEQAKIVLDRKQTVLPASEYQTLRAQASELRSQIDAQQLIFDAERLASVQQAQQDQTALARQKLAQDKYEQVQMLLRRASELRKEQKYDQALSYLDKILLFEDPQNVAAQAMKEMIEDSRTYVKYREVERRRAVKISQYQLDNLNATMPETELMTYPSDWPELTARRLKGMTSDIGESEANRRVSLKLKESVPINFEANRLQNVVEYLRNTTGLNFFVNWTKLQEVGVEPDKAISLQLANVPADQALKLVLQQASSGDETNPVTYSIIEGIVTISTQKDLTRTVETRVIDIRDLLVNVPNFGGVPEFDLSSALSSSGTNSGGGGGGGSSSSLFGSNASNTNAEPQLNRDQLIKQITDLIQNTVGHPTEWAEYGGDVSSVRELNGNLIIKTTPQNHRQMFSLLSQLRETRAMQISVEGRFLLVDQNFLEEIGLDIDVQQNLGGPWGDIKLSQDTASIASRANTGLPGSFGSIAVSQGPIPEFVKGSGFSTDGSGAGRSMDLGFSYIDDLKVNFLLRASQLKRHSISLTAPRVTFFNGQQAHVMVARQISFISDLEPIPDATGFRPTLSVTQSGVVLKVQGTISADRRYVTMTVEPSLATVAQPIRKIFQSTSNNNNNNSNNNNNNNSNNNNNNENASQTTAFIEAPEIELTQIKTTVSVPDRGTLLLGGQRLVAEVEVEAGVPILSKIPVINRFFTNTSTVKDERTLLILIKPTIIIQGEEEENLFPGLLQDPGKYNVGRTSHNNNGVSGTNFTP